MAKKQTNPEIKPLSSKGIFQWENLCLLILTYSTAVKGRGAPSRAMATILFFLVWTRFIGLLWEVIPGNTSVYFWMLRVCTMHCLKFYPLLLFSPVIWGFPPIIGSFLLLLLLSSSSCSSSTPSTCLGQISAGLRARQGAITGQESLPAPQMLFLTL